MFTRPASTASSLPALVSSRLAAALLSALSLCCPEEIHALEFFGVHIHPITPTYLPATMPQQIALARASAPRWCGSRSPGHGSRRGSRAEATGSPRSRASWIPSSTRRRPPASRCSRWSCRTLAGPRAIRRRAATPTSSGTTAFHRRTSPTTPDSSWTFTSSRREGSSTGRSGTSRISTSSGKTPTRSPTRPCSWLPTRP